MKKNITIKDISKLAGVTNITVSRVFNNPEIVNEVTRNKIINIANELGYRPNIYARKLRGKSNRIVGLVTNSLFNPVYLDIMKVISEKLNEKNIVLMIFETNGDIKSEERAIHTLCDYQVDAILLSAITDQEDYYPNYIKDAKEMNIPLLLIDRDVPDLELPGVFLKNYDIGIQVGEYVSQAKKSGKILIIGGPSNSIITRKRIKGILSKLGSFDTEILYSDYSFGKSYPTILEKLKSLDEKPSWIIGINGLISLASIKAASVLKLSDINIFSIDSVPGADIFDVHIPCIATNNDLWGERIFDLLYSILNKNNSNLNNQKIYMESNIINI